MTLGFRVVPGDFDGLAQAFAQAQAELDQLARDLFVQLWVTAERRSLPGLSSGAEAFNRAHEELAEGILSTLALAVERLGEAATVAWATGQNYRTADFDSNVSRVGSSPQETGPPAVLTGEVYFFHPAASGSGVADEQASIEALNTLGDHWRALHDGLRGVAVGLGRMVAAVRSNNAAPSVDLIEEYWGKLWPRHGSLFDRLLEASAALSVLVRGGTDVTSWVSTLLAGVSPADPVRERLLTQLDSVLVDQAGRCNAGGLRDDLSRAAGHVPVLRRRDARTWPVRRVEPSSAVSGTALPHRDAGGRRHAPQVAPKQIAPPDTWDGRLAAVAALAGGRILTGVNRKLSASGRGSTDADVQSDDGKLICLFASGRLARSGDLLQQKLVVLREATKGRGVAAQAYVEQDGDEQTRGGAAALARRVLGRENVFRFVPLERPVSDAFFRWYRPEFSAAEATDLMRFLADQGLTAARKPEAEEAALSTALGKLSDVTAAEEGCSFQLWLDQDTDLWVSARSCSEGLLAFDFALDGLGTRQQDVIALLVRAMDQSGRVSGFVLDYTGRSERVNWDAVMSGAPVRITAAPHNVGLAPRIAAAHDELRQLTSQAYQGLRVYTWPVGQGQEP